MAQEDRIEPDGRDDGRQARQRALRALAQDQAGVDVASGEGQPRVSGGAEGTARRWGPRPWQVGSVLVLVAAAVIAALVGVQHGGHSAPRTSTPAAVEIVPRQFGFDCPQGAAWSPDGTRVALLGYELQCPVELTQGEYDSGPAYAPFDSPTGQLLSVGHGTAPLKGLLVVFDSATGKQRLRVQPDAAIQQMFPIPSSVVQVYASTNARPQLEIHYTHVVWVPNSSTLAVSFTTFVPDGPPPQDPSSPWRGTAVYGVVLVGLNGSMRILTHTVSYPGPTPTLEWDLSTGQPVALPPALTSPTTRASLAPALAYAWGPDGALTAEQPVGASATASIPSSALSTPIGAAGGGSRFTIWQPGRLSYTDDMPGTPPVATWQPDFAAISPDGRYLLVAASLAGQLDAQGTASLTRDTLTLPARDAGLRAFEAALDEQHAYGTTSRLAWRPDGRVLAAQPMDTTNSQAPEKHRVFLYDCQTGAQLAALLPLGSNLSAVEDEEPPLLAWSPDGTRLLLLDPALGTATIWLSASLPRG